MPEPARTDAAAGPKESGQRKKQGVRKALDFLAGPEADLKDDRSAELPGVFSFVRRHWGSQAPDAKDESFFQRYRRLNREYQEVKARQVDNLQAYETIAKAARLSKEFLALLFAACIIATFGLFASSTATIIGAMLVAPLMMPILGFALGTIWGDTRLLWRSLATLGIGTLLVLIVSMMLTAVIPGVEVTPEMAARTNPSLYDILVAIGSGLIGAYAFVNPRISSSIAGVAIAVALMPPLCTVGIGIGLERGDVAVGALLLYLSNLVGISLAASFVFWRLRVHPPLATREEVGSRAKRNVAVTTVLLVLIALPLAYLMHRTFELKEQHAAVRGILVTELPDANVLSLTVERSGEGHDVRAVIIVPPDVRDESMLAARERIGALFSDDSVIEVTALRAHAMGGDVPDDRLARGAPESATLAAAETSSAELEERPEKGTEPPATRSRERRRR